MSTQANAMPDSFGTQRAAPATESPTRPLYWSIRREFWEYRSLYVAPLAVAVAYLFGYLVSLIHLPVRMRAASALDPMKQQEMIQQPYHFAALIIMGTTLFVAVYYSLDALHSERRDRSILFWKSLPVSDLTTVLSKASIPILILPLITFAVTVVLQTLMLLLNITVVAASGLSVATLWTQLSLFQVMFGLFFHLVAMHGLYYGPFYGWFLLVSAWARRTAFLWAFVPLFAIAIVEKIAFNSAHFANFLGSRVGGPSAIPYPPEHMAIHNSTLLMVTSFLTSPGLWIGLAVTGIFLAGAVRLRRYREPI